MIEHIEKRWLSAYIDDQLSSSQHIQVQEHLVACAACRAYLLDLQRLQQQLKMLRRSDTQIDVREQTLALLAELTPTVGTKTWSVLEYGAAVASIVCGLLIGTLMMPAEIKPPSDLVVVQALGSEPSGSLCSVSAYCYLEPRK